MKQIFHILLLGLVLGIGYLCQASTSQEDPLTTAEDFYRNAQYANALMRYEQDLKNHPNDPYLYYNIGNCYFKMGSKGLAAANYYRAFKLNPRNNDVRHNLSLALASGGQAFVPAGVPTILHKAFFVLSLQELQGLFCVSGWLVGLIAGFWLLTRKGGKVTIGLGIIFVLVAGWFYIRHSWENEPLAVVASPVVELRSGPGKNFPVSASVQQGHLVEVLDTKDNWEEVVVRSEGLKGWIEHTALEHI